ncbi:MAG: pyruvate formate-lyase-activating protein [Bacteroidales bacterium]|nr:pyruvate formate-lyase-activating protein [Bacteroidales bacterium]
MKGLIHSTESFGSVDGPGIRYIIFMQGCDMRCRYCHNPDSWGKSENDNPNAKYMEVGEILDKAERFRSYWGVTMSNGLTLGGITTSGGEPLLQIDFLIELYQEAHRRGISTCLDTSGQHFVKDGQWRGQFDKLMSVTDTVMLDIKHFDQDAHKRLTGQGNDNIKECAKAVDENGVDLWIRHVLVPGWTDSDDNLRAIRTFADSLRNVKKIEVLPYHDMAKFKYEKLGIPYTRADVPCPTKEQVAHAEAILCKDLTQN